MKLTSSSVKKRIYEIIEVGHNNDMASIFYDSTIIVAILVGFTPLMLRITNVYTKLIDLIVILIFIIDYFLRIYTSDYKMGIKDIHAYLYYATTPMAIIDLLCIVPIFSFILPGTHDIIEFFRLFRILQVLKVIRYSSTMTTISNVIKRVKKELFAVLTFTVIYIYASALIVFQLEPEIFEHFFDALYWSTISITTIGYGDISPKTEIGRCVTMISALVGVAIIALPSGIITAGYMEEIKRKKNRKNDLTL
ncbi:MAG: ion transporter [Butyrivibrio sp.]|nr:ion transporter [Butyrivibrio sp.]